MRIRSKENLYGEYVVPSDKSITSRAIILGTIAKGKTYVINPIMCSDTQTMISCVKRLGAKVRVKDKIIEIRRPKKFRDNQRFDCGNSGTTLRFLCGVAAGSKIKAVLTGDKSLNQRPMRKIKEPLEAMGATVALKNYSVPPVLVEGENVREIDYPMTIGSSQIKSAILLCALQGGVRATVKEEFPTRDHMEILLKEMGANITKDSATGVITLEKSEIKGTKIFICGDFSVAANFIGLGLMCGKTTVKNVGINPTRTALLPILERMGARIEITNRRLLCGEHIADITAYKSQLTATHVTGHEVLKIVDELPILAVLMGMASGESIVGGLGELQYKEADRLTEIVEMINSIGGRARKFDGGIVLNGVERYEGGEVATYGDERIAMSAVMALTASKYGGEIDDETCIENGFPGFFEAFEKNAFVKLSASSTNDEGNKMHAFILKKMNLKNFTYSYLNVPDLTARKAFYEVKDFEGYTVNSPFSSEAVKRVTKTVGNAKIIKSANVVKGGIGYSTDGDGFLLTLKNRGIDIVGKKVLVVGCGAVAKSVILSALEQKAFVTVCNRTAKTARDFTKKLQSVVVKDALNDDMGFDIVVNATPVGGGYYLGESTVSKSVIKNSHTIVDLVILPEKTRMIEMAEELGKTTVKGREVLFFTTYLSVCVLVGKAPSDEEAYALYKEYSEWR